MRDKKSFTDDLPADGSAQLHDATIGLTTIGLWGPRARDVLGRRPTRTTSRHEGFPFLTVEDGRHQRRPGARVADLATSASSAGRSTSRSSRGCGSGTRSGRPAGRTAWRRSGIGDYAVTARLEKGYRAHGNELELDFNLVEAGMARPTVKDADFIGREAYLRQRRAAGRGAVHADGRRPDVVERRQALHARARADPDARRRAARRRQGPRLVRDERRVRAVGREAPADVVPAARVREGRARQLARRVLRRAVPGDGRGRRQRRRCSIPTNARIRS